MTDTPISLRVSLSTQIGTLYLEPIRDRLAYLATGPMKAVMIEGVPLMVTARLIADDKGRWTLREDDLWAEQPRASDDPGQRQATQTQRERLRAVILAAVQAWTDDNDHVLRILQSILHYQRRGGQVRQLQHRLANLQANLSIVIRALPEAIAQLAAIDDALGVHPAPLIPRDETRA